MATIRQIAKSLGMVHGAGEQLAIPDFNPLVALIKKLGEDHRQIIGDSKRWAEAAAIVSEELPKRGWYLNGTEPCTWVGTLATYVEKKDWRGLDDAILAHIGKLKIKVEGLTTWLKEKGVPDHCINRVRLFLDQYHAKNHEVAVVFGIPLIDEITRHLYSSKDFTTKRNKQPKPQIGCRTTSGPDLVQFSNRFVQQFGSIHGDVDPRRLADEDYFNRAAIVHGQMQRSYGPKDSAKALMALLFVVLGYDERPESKEPSVEEIAP